MDELKSYQHVTQGCLVFHSRQRGTAWTLHVARLIDGQTESKDRFEVVY
jgi:hypothetical protein